VSTIPDDGEYLGASIGNSNSAEIFDQAWAFMFGLQLPATDIVIEYGSEFARAAACATWQISAYAELAQVASGLLAMLRTQSHVTFNRIEGHSGHPWNDHADSLCDFSSNGSWMSLWNGTPAHWWATHAPELAAWGHVTLIPDVLIDNRVWFVIQRY
jgi:hypothetical protein